ncbi:sensor histidine kinase [Microtetraspora glauca]|uniref:histidine kinase n=1 Tax=Microtetraspora glauca TaxID=1996 RepID=A0ABV3GJD0_MICGL
MRTRGRWTLRARLVAAAVALTAVALVLANAAGLALLRGYLVDRLDAQLRASVPSAPSGTFTVTPNPAYPPKDDPEPVQLVVIGNTLVERMVGERRLYMFDSVGRLVSEFPVRPAERPVLGPYRDLRRDGPYTVPGTGAPSWRVLVAALPDGGTAVLAASLADVEATHRRLLAIDGAVTAVVLLLLGLAATALVRLGMRPLTRIEETAARIAAGDFGSRVPESEPDTEPGRLGVAMNVMLDRVESEIAARTESEAGMRRFLADASHELRTPLTSVLGFAELYRQGGTPPGAPMDEAMRRIEDEATRMGLLVNDLLVLAHLDEERPLASGPVDLLEIAIDTVRDARARQPERRIRMTGQDGALAPVIVTGDEARLRQVAANLVANALAHTPPGTEVTVAVGAGRPTEAPAAAVGSRPPGSPLMGVLDVRDTGQGIPAEHVTRIFERLYRVSQSRSRADGGAGLGLAIVAAIVKAHAGRVEVATAPGEGSAFRVLLPLRHPEEIRGDPVRSAEIPKRVRDREETLEAARRT